ncbi:MAG: hypothetical protein PHV34_19050 [Verrucomicrobiae bacterium]|nr:hypothetical protein [Verrucomicrobiae bacterium]
MAAHDLSRSFEWMARKVKKGHPILNSLKEARHLCIDPQAVAIMDEVFHQMASGQSLWEPIKSLKPSSSVRQFIHQVETSDGMVDAAKIFEDFARVLADAGKEESAPGGNRSCAP